MTSAVSQSSASESFRMSLREKGALLVLCGAIFLEGLDIAMLNVALPQIRADLGLSTTTLGAVVSSYVIGYAGFMLLGGRICDLYGRRRVFLSCQAVPRGSGANKEHKKLDDRGARHRSQTVWRIRERPQGEIVIA